MTAMELKLDALKSTLREVSVEIYRVGGSTVDNAPFYDGTDVINTLQEQIDELEKLIKGQ